MNNLFKINGNPEQYEDLDVFHKLAQQFLPYAQQSLGFDKPVGVNLLSDPENVKDPLGKTAYYDPNKMEITLFVDKRHVKDVLRSMAHELVHHTQNCRGEFDGGVETGPGYAQDDEHMRKMEAEAYLKGSGFLLRDWEDSLKKENQVMSRKKLKEEQSIFAPNHYCVHHGGVHMEGKVKLGKVIGHNWSNKLNRVTKYDMQFTDGTILENIKAEDILVTNATLAENHPSHEAKVDEEGMDEDYVKGAKKAAKGASDVVKKSVAKKAARGAAEKILPAQDVAKVTKDLEEDVKEGSNPRGKDKDLKKTKKSNSNKDGMTLDPPSTAKADDITLEGKEVKNKWVDPLGKKGTVLCDPDCTEKEAAGRIKKSVARGAKNENWTRGNKNQLLFERLIEKWIK